MMQTKKTNPWNRVKLALTIPVAAVAVAAFATPTAEQMSNEFTAENNRLMQEVMPAVQSEQPGETAEAPQDQKDKAFDIVDEMPKFPGGMSALNQWLCSNLRYPIEAHKKGLQGRVIVRFVVDKSGAVRDAKIAKGVDPLLDTEALRIVNSMPAWEPGKLDGKPVSVNFTMPVSFRFSSPTSKDVKE